MGQFRPPHGIHASWRPDGLGGYRPPTEAELAQWHESQAWHAAERRRREERAARFKRLSAWAGLAMLAWVIAIFIV